MDLTGTTLGAYEIKELIGRGGMAAVYRAYHAATGRDVAIKVILPNYAQNPNFSKRFEREAKALASLQHTHILPVFDYGESSGVRYLVMPLVRQGQSLADKLRLKRLDTKEVARLLRQIAGALDYAHAQGLLHRDIKPGNVLIDPSGNALLADFGLIRMMDGSDSQLTTDSTVVGTPSYMSPEQGQGHTVDQRSDLYSLGVMLYEMLTGNVPFKADTPVAVIFKHVTEPTPRIQIHRQDLPPAVDDVLDKALAKQPADRYQSGKAMADALDAALSGKSVAEVQAIGEAPPVVPLRLPDDEPTAILGETKPASGHVIDADAPTRQFSTHDGDKLKGKPITPRRGLSVGVAAALVIAIGAAVWVGLSNKAAGDTPAAVFTIPAADEVTSLDFNSDGSQLLVGTEDNSAYVYDSTTGTEIFHLEAHSGDVLSVAYAPDGAEIITGGADSTLYRWNASDGSVKITGLEGGSVRAVTYSARYYAYATNITLALGSPAGAGARFYRPSPAEANILTIAINQAETLVATGDTGGTLQLWDVQGGDVVESHQSLSLPLVAVAFQGASDTAVAAYSNGVVIHYQPGQGVTQTFETGADLLGMAVSPDGTRMATAHKDGKTILWNAANGTLITTYLGATPMRAVAFSPDGTRLVGGGAGEAIKIWTLPEGAR